jgi:hypothetical protein
LAPQRGFAFASFRRTLAEDARMGCFAHFRGPPRARGRLPRVHLTGNDRLRAVVDRDVLMDHSDCLLPDPPPLKWSALRYGFRAEEDRDAEEETQA